jgi:uncharacterized protein YggE
MKRLLLAVLALVSVVAVAGTVGTPDFARAEDPGASPDSDIVVVTGVGSVKAVPDEAELSFGVETRASTARAALAANGTAMRKVIAALRDAGAREIATEYVSVWPATGENGAVDGYSATNSVSATTDVERAGDLIDAATDAGANNVSGPGLSRSDSDRIYRQALAAAIADAKLRAEALAKAAGRSLGQITTISESGESPVPYYERTAVAADASTPVVPGKQETSASVSVTFELR